MKEIKQEITKYVDECPFCKKEIVGTSESQIKYNMELHIKQKHKKKLVKDKQNQQVDKGETS